MTAFKPNQYRLSNYAICNHLALRSASHGILWTSRYCNCQKTLYVVAFVQRATPFSEFGWQ